MSRRSGDMVIRVYGTARPWPKVQTGYKERKGKIVPIPLKKDFRTRTVTDPWTGEKSTQRHDRGYKMRWFEHVRENVLIWMREHERQPFERNHPVAIGCLFFVQKPKSSQLPYPTCTPDLDNYRYGIPNMLKRTPDIKRGVVPGPYPEGVAFYDDDQVIWAASPDGMLWASQANPPGVLITIIDLIQRPDPLEWGRAIDKDVCAQTVALGNEALYG